MNAIIPISTYKAIDREISTLNLDELQQERGIQAEPFIALVQNVVTIYHGLTLLLTVFSSLPLMRPKWRAAVTAWLQALDKLAAATPPATPVVASATADIDPTTNPINSDPSFKAGKDL